MMGDHLPCVAASGHRGQSSVGIRAEEGKAPRIVAWLEELKILSWLFHSIVAGLGGRILGRLLDETQVTAVLKEEEGMGEEMALTASLQQQTVLLFLLKQPLLFLFLRFS